MWSQRRIIVCLLILPPLLNTDVLVVKGERSWWMINILTLTMVYLMQYPEYEDCIELYRNNLSQVIYEYPFRITYKIEKTVDTSRDLFSAFWEVARSLSSSPYRHVLLHSAWFYSSSWTMWFAAQPSGFSVVAWLWYSDPWWKYYPFIHRLCQCLWEFCVSWNSASV